MVTIKIDRARFSVNLIWCPACNLPSFVRGTIKSREGSICIWCRSNSRQRAIVSLVRRAAEILGNEGSIAKVVGISDGQITEKWAKRKFGGHYKNFHYHQEPALDLIQVESQNFAIANIVICSEVLEHVEPPVARAFSGLAKLLAPGGFLVVSVPYTTSGIAHVEHFEELVDGKLNKFQGGYMWTGKNPEGIEKEYTDLTFHGGVGTTLEFRVFSEESLQANLAEAGFSMIKILENQRRSGIVRESWSRVWLVRKN